ncbi:MAG TPA: pantetheine-phosphate adenylyltransferase [Gemmatimonadetes bacterium]|jgi:pantetheine-phosphate adenylyltransferase|nr:pantetheine-phosphate adenylyltransferase [Gemmatimonadota bacterium]HIC13720.1 pantetheine-phosphate adenylyltransferase [Gemmatimonadota bacterium]
MSPSRPVVAIYPGSFDPITKGHEDLVRRTLRVTDRLVIAVSSTSTESKKHLFELEERLELIQKIFNKDKRVEVRRFDGLLVDFARDLGAQVVIRGLRAVSDFDYELQMAQMNQELGPEIETLFLVPDVEYSFLSASLVREVASLGGDVSRFVSAPVLTRLKQKLGQ